MCAFLLLLTDNSLFVPFSFSFLSFFSLQRRPHPSSWMTTCLSLRCLLRRTRSRHTSFFLHMIDCARLSIFLCACDVCLLNVCAFCYSISLISHSRRLHFFQGEKFFFFSAAVCSQRYFIFCFRVANVQLPLLFATDCSLIYLLFFFKKKNEKEKVPLFGSVNLTMPAICYSYFANQNRTNRQRKFTQHIFYERAEVLCDCEKNRITMTKLSQS